MMKKLWLFFITFILFLGCGRDEMTDFAVNRIYDEDLIPLQGEWVSGDNYININDKSVILNFCDTLACDTSGMPITNFYTVGNSVSCGDTIIYHGEFWYLDNRGFTVDLNERANWSFRYEFDGEDQLWINRDTNPEHIIYKYTNLLFFKVIK